jgi:MtN3 and saliva related transmembrane protein
MDIVTIIGTIACVFTGTSLIPQLVKVIKDKTTDGLSFGMLGVLSVGLVSWVCYGVLKEDWIIIVSNAFSLAINITIGALSLIYRAR